MNRDQITWLIANWQLVLGGLMLFVVLDFGLLMLVIVWTLIRGD